MQNCFDKNIKMPLKTQKYVRTNGKLSHIT